MIKPIGSMLVGTVFDRGGESYVLRAKTETVCHAFRERDDKLVTFDAGAVGDARLVPDFCIFEPLKSVGAS